MPRIGSGLIDVAGAELIHQWIASLPEDASATAGAGNQTTRTIRSALRELLAGEANRARTPKDLLSQLLQTPAGALGLVREISQRSLSSDLQQNAVALGTSAADPLVRDLFERFIPEENRVKRLGATFDPAVILSLKGDAARGRTVFFQPGSVQCYQCHQVGKEGRNFGPDLSQIARKFDRPQILDHIINPSKVIDPPYRIHSIETKGDLLYSGFLIKTNAEEMVLKDATLAEVHVKTAEVNHSQALQASAMPEGLLQSLTAQEAADLLEYLVSLR
jgi:putative heme-binding domain-containing protein